jgi:hypothetical protein
MASNPDIHCPRCSYKPRAEDRWSCIAPCNTLWHTFWTAGVCPGCTRQWTNTQCPACDQVSPHKAWYHLPEGEPAGEALGEHEREPADPRVPAEHP